MPDELPPRKSTVDILELYEARKSQMQARRASMERITALYNSQVEVPLSEMDATEKPSVANMIRIGIDHYAGRIASAMPNLVTPPLRPGVNASESKARLRRHALLAWQEMCGLDLQMYKRARELMGYSFSVTEIRWDTKAMVPKWQWRNPMHAFPPSSLGIALLRPPDMVYAYMWPIWHASAVFSEAAAFLYGKDPNMLVEVIEYVDARERTVIVRESQPRERDTQAHEILPPTVSEPRGGNPDRFMEVSRAPNPLKMCAATVTEGIGLAGPVGRFDDLEGIYMAQARMFALERIAIEKGIFPDTWLESRPAEVGTVTQEADGLSGQMGEVSGGELKMLQAQPGYQTASMIDALERNQRMAGGISPEFSGESPSNVRTGRRGSAVLAESVNYTIMETQRILSAALSAECEMALEAAKAYMPRSEITVESLAAGRAKYKAADDFDSTKVQVRYPLPGADSAEAVVAAAQRVGMGVMSKRSFAEMDPMVPDAEIEMDRVTAERLEEALLAGLTQQAAEGAIPPGDLADIMRDVQSNSKSLAEAVEAAQKRAQERQAEAAPQGSPETQPGIAQPGMGAEQPALPPGAEQLALPAGPPPGPVPAMAGAAAGPPGPGGPAMEPAGAAGMPPLDALLGQL